MDLKKVKCSTIKLGMRFSMPVFFDDGKNMFLAKRHAVKKYHLNALTQWEIPFLLTAGEVLPEIDEAKEKDMAGFAKRGAYSDAEDVEELEDLEEVEELEELEDAPVA